MRESISSSSMPPRPTKGSPWRSSCSPGPSPMNMISAFFCPAPNTTLVRVSARAQRWQAMHRRSNSSQAVMEPFLQCFVLLQLSYHKRPGKAKENPIGPLRRRGGPNLETGWAKIDKNGRNNGNEDRQNGQGVIEQNHRSSRLARKEKREEDARPTCAGEHDTRGKFFTGEERSG